MAYPGAHFPKSARLLRPSEFRDVFRKPLVSRDAFFAVMARPNRVGTDRLGLAISRKCAPRAVDRSRIKRIVRESFRRHRSRLRGLDCVVLCASGTPDTANDVLFTSLDAHWDRLSGHSCKS